MAQSILHRISTLHFGAKTCPNLIYLHHTRKKDLTYIAFARILAQGAHRFRTSLSHWRPRAKIRAKAMYVKSFCGCGANKLNLGKSLHFGAKTCPNLIYLHHTRKKDLTYIAFARILARGRQCESDVRNRCAPCAKIRAKAMYVKSFLRVWCK